MEKENNCDIHIECHDFTSPFVYFRQLYWGGIVQQINDIFCVLFKETIVRAAVPAFFIISGALFFRNYTNAKYLEKLKSRIHSLVIPYLIWNTIWMLFNIAISYSFISEYFVGREKYVVSVSNILLGIFHYKGLPALWFIFDLIFFVLISPLIDLLISSKWLGFISIMILIGMAQLGIELPESVFFDGSSIIYYMVGAMVGKYFMEEFQRKSTKREVVIAGFLCAVGIVYRYCVFCEYLVLLQAVEIVLLGIMAFALWVLLDPLTEKIKHIELMRESFMIYVLHGNLNSIVTKLLYLVLPSNICFAIPNYLLSVVLVLVSIHVFCWVLRKYAEPLYLVVSGSRNV